MAKLSLVRIDSRLIHGQITTRWIAISGANRIVIVDNATAADPFMAKVLSLAAPPGIKLQVMTAQKAGDEWQKDEMGQGNILVLFVDVPNAYDAYMKGFKYSLLQVGGIGSGPGRTSVAGPITLNEADAKKLQEIAADGCEVVFQVLPEMPEKSWKEIKDKFFPDV
ncbi:MAG: PTS sugar transporter subunit IIB [Lachnospiraceae bacterium]|jgi:mannose/fructose/N-acetylgalactosamine-specific phosphotransferase system component IIB|nr:PTS sugar transporter subunit IIB [Lachnospiraceae bacterium]